MENENMENIIKPIAVGDLLKQENNESFYNFFIPSYQRGYRWDKHQVEDLLDDLYEFIINSYNRDEKYCLQPVVVKQLEDGRYEVLDGQQRLTTIYILLTRLKKNNSEIDLFSLEYETRLDSQEFLREGLNGIINKENPDYYYMSNAYVVIDEWLLNAKKVKANIASSLFDAIVESIEFIWYEIKNKVDAIDVFTRINIGKIPLTNSELVKAVFLSRNNLSIGYISEKVKDNSFEKLLSLKQNAIALEWDLMEKTLQNDKFWGFIYAGNYKYDTKIDYLLDLCSGKHNTEPNKYFSFKFFYDKFKGYRSDNILLEELNKSNKSVIEEEWNKIKEVYNILLEWYNDKNYNHLIGFLINQNDTISNIIDSFKNKNKKDFLKEIKSKIKNKITSRDISLLRYGSDNKDIENILLLHNVINSLLIKDNNVYFPFEKMKNKLWTLEHVFAQNSDEIKEEDYIAWLGDHKEYFEDFTNSEEADKIKNDINTLLLNLEKEKFQNLVITVNYFINIEIQKIDKENEINDHEEYLWLNEDHSISNLALLDGSINSAIKNSLFDKKRNLILNKDKSGLFVPSETKKVFLKYYTEKPKHLAYWTYIDRKAYVESIKESLKYLNQ